MNTMIVTTPIRPIPTPFPPIGSLSLIRYLKMHGEPDVEFFDIDGNRPSYDEVLAHILERKPRVLGISAVVSTAYAYTKRLSSDVKKHLPETLVVCGGNLAASAEILLKRTGIDLCVSGEGEKTFLNIVRRSHKTTEPTAYSDIPGIVLFDRNGYLVNTGYEEQLPAEEVYDFDWADLERASDIGVFVLPGVVDGMPSDSFRDDPRAYEPERADKTQITIPAAKGCVAKCTFCHRFTKGIRYIPVDIVIERLKHVIDRYNVGFVDIADENFGTSRKWLREFCAKIKPLDVLWKVGGMRVNCVDPEIIALMKDAGCSSIIYGMETGSEKMLQVMEKKVALRDNYNAMRWTVEAGLRTIIQLVVGMPGETPETIRETADFAKFGLSISPSQCPTDLSINYAQALPGTPLYEFARHQGLIGAGVDGEEAYLLRISDTNAHDESNTLNFTPYPTLLCQAWRPMIQLETFMAYQKKFGRAHYRRMVLERSNYFERDKSDSGYFANPKRLVDRSATTDTIHQRRETLTVGDDEAYPTFWSLIRNMQVGMAIICYPEMFARIRWVLVPLIVLRNLRYRGATKTARLAWEALTFLVGNPLRRRLNLEGRSLRKVVTDLEVLAGDPPEMGSLRRGR
ncbi:MAG: radical SAM protein [Rhodospirillales bacterium CG15_BIG_FIL_POST_REV_8_21_14_020_66_15]|nr:MAG: radical SAM protein [Rhodospirillales bacterium CG15_BIG_FIL_POST_REV_8_21_14_020_66_15]